MKLNKNDLITHCNQTYERSIYKLIQEINNEKELNLAIKLLSPSPQEKKHIKKWAKNNYPISLLETFAFNGFLFPNGHIIFHENVSNFRLASKDEIDIKTRKGLLPLK